MSDDEFRHRLIQLLEIIAENGIGPNDKFIRLPHDVRVERERGA